MSSYVLKVPEILGFFFCTCFFHCCPPKDDSRILKDRSINRKAMVSLLNVVFSMKISPCAFHEKSRDELYIPTLPVYYTDAGIEHFIQSIPSNFIVQADAQTRHTPSNVR